MTGQPCPTLERTPAVSATVRVSQGAEETDYNTNRSFQSTAPGSHLLLMKTARKNRRFTSRS